MNETTQSGKKKSGWAKKVVLSLFGLGFLLVAAAIIIPLVVDVDQFRPMIVETANRHINGKLEIGKLKLSLWGRILVKVDGVALSDAKGAKVVSVADAYFHVPFSSLFSGSPILTFRMTAPVLSVIKDKTGQLNVMALVKKKAGESDAGAQAPGQAAQAAAPGSPAAAGAKSVALPALATQARLGIELIDAKLSYQDQLTGLVNDLQGLNLRIKDISLSRPTELELWADLETRLGKTMQVSGPFRVSAIAKPEFSGAQFTRASANLKADFDKIEVRVPGAFVKSKSIPAHMEMQVLVTPSEAKIERMLTVFHNVEVNTSGLVKNLGAQPASPGAKPASPVTDLKIESNEFALGPWVELIPAMQGFELSGTTLLKASVSGPSDRLDYTADLALKNWSAKAPRLKAKPVINGVVKVVTDQIESMLFTLTAPGNDLKIQGSLKSFLKPNLRVAVTSKGMDLDQLVEFPPRAKAAKAAGASESSAPAQVGGTAPEAASGSKTAASPAAAGADFDALLDPMRANPIAAATVAEITADIPRLKAYGIDMQDIAAKLTMKNLVAAIESFKMSLWSGTIGGSFSLDMKPKQPTYTMSASVSGLELEKAVASQLELFKNTIVGKAYFSMKGTGASLNPDTAMKRLNIQGNMKVQNATFATIDVGRMTKEALNGALDRLGGKVPALKGRKIGDLQNRESKYEYISSDFSMKDGEFQAPNFVAKAASSQAVDLQGKTKVGMIDYSLDAQWSVIDTYNVTKAKDLSVDVNGVNVEHVLAKGTPPVVSFPVNVGCKLTAPCYSYTEVPEHFAKIAMSNIGDAAKNKLKNEARKKVEEKAQQVIQDKAPEAAKDAAKKLFKKFGF